MGNPWRDRARYVLYGLFEPVQAHLDAALL